MSKILIPTLSNKTSKAMAKKRQKSEYWRNIHECREALEAAKNSFQQEIVVTTIKTADSAESFFAIIDSRRGIVIK